jgi:hypothetical protein
MMKGYLVGNLLCLYSKIQKTDEGISGGPVGVIVNKRKEYAYLFFEQKDDAKEFMKQMKIHSVEILSTDEIGNESHPVIKNMNKKKLAIILKKEDISFIKENGRLSDFEGRIIKL